jgi:hypothetical protein
VKILEGDVRTARKTAFKKFVKAGIIKIILKKFERKFNKSNS